MKEKIRQYKNLILLSVAVILLVALIASDPLGFCAQRAHDRAAIYNQMAVEKAEAEKQIAIIRAQTDAELERIAKGGDLTEDVSYEGPAEDIESERDTSVEANE